VAEAHAAYADGLALRRQLRASLGDQPGVLADLARAAGRLELWAERLDAATQAHALSPTARHADLVAWARRAGA
jgi:hypothetical protein